MVAGSNPAAGTTGPIFERYGYKPLKSIIQKDFIDEDLRTSLWNSAQRVFWELYSAHWMFDSPRKIHFQEIWVDYFKEPLEDIPSTVLQAVAIIRNDFFRCEWYEVYDFIEFLAERADDVEAEVFTTLCNDVLTREVSAYRFIGRKITPITDQVEIEAIESALEASQPFPGMRIHLQSALEKLSDRKNPDYRNSIKESISAVESLANQFTGREKATLSDALKTLESRIKLHRALKEAFSKLYGYTSDAEGIRHSMLEESTLTFSDAKFMLVSCSAFVNYLIGKATESGVDLTQAKLPKTQRG